MAASDEWEEEHLTPNGWVSGSYQHDFGKTVEKPTPPDAVLTVRLHVVIPAAGADVRRNQTETPLIADSARIKALRTQHGEPTFGV